VLTLLCPQPARAVRGQPVAAADGAWSFVAWVRTYDRRLLLLQLLYQRLVDRRLDVRDQMATRLEQRHLRVDGRWPNLEHDICSQSARHVHDFGTGS
jgi:hypothetical protein